MATTVYKTDVCRMALRPPNANPEAWWQDRLLGLDTSISRPVRSTSLKVSHIIGTNGMNPRVIRSLHDRR